MRNTLETSILLWHGMGFAGSQYSLEVGNKHWTLLSDVNGSSEDEKVAREKAKEILDKEFPDNSFSVDDIPFEWDGTI